jgi:hypothetical protein
LDEAEKIALDTFDTWDSQSGKIIIFGADSGIFNKMIIYVCNLMTNISFYGKSFYWRWGSPEKSGYVNQIPVAPPVVIEDNDNYYRTELTDGPTLYQFRRKISSFTPTSQGDGGGVPSPLLLVALAALLLTHRLRNCR